MYVCNYTSCMYIYTTCMCIYFMYVQWREVADDDLSIGTSETQSMIENTDLMLSPYSAYSENTDLW